MENGIREADRQLCVREIADVVVVGGGTAGCISAIAAARAGAKVVLIEKMPYLGGQFTAGGMIANSLYASTDDNRHALRLVRGLAGELIDRLIREKASPGFIPTRQGNHYRRPYIVSIDHEMFHSTIGTMLDEAGVTVYPDSIVTEAISENGHISGVIVQDPCERFVIRASQFVDASGDGDLARLVGCRQSDLWEEYGTNQMGLAFGINGVDYEELCRVGTEDGFLVEKDSIYDEGGKPVNGYIRMLLNFGNVRDPAKYKGLTDNGIGACLCLSVHPDQMTYSNSVNIRAMDVMKADMLSRAECDLRRAIIRHCELLRRYLPGFENAYVQWSADHVGIRVTRVTMCEKDLTNEEICAGKRFEDEIGLYGFHDLLPVVPDCAIRGEGYFGLPYRMIVPQGADNLLMAGRTITNEFKAHMVTRNTMCCMLTGQAAGAAAALCARMKTAPAALEYAQLRRVLLEQGVKLTVENGSR